MLTFLVTLRDDVRAELGDMKWLADDDRILELEATALTVVVLQYEGVGVWLHDDDML